MRFMLLGLLVASALPALAEPYVGVLRETPDGATLALDAGDPFEVSDRNLAGKRLRDLARRAKEPLRVRFEGHTQVSLTGERTLVVTALEPKEPLRLKATLGPEGFTLEDGGVRQGVGTLAPYLLQTGAGLRVTLQAFPCETLEGAPALLVLAVRAYVRRRAPVYQHEGEGQFRREGTTPETTSFWLERIPAESRFEGRSARMVPVTGRKAPEGAHWRLSDVLYLSPRAPERPQAEVAAPPRKGLLDRVLGRGR